MLIKGSFILIKNCVMLIVMILNALPEPEKEEAEAYDNPYSAENARRPGCGDYKRLEKTVFFS